MDVCWAMKQYSQQFCARKSRYFCQFLQFQAPKSCYFCPFLLAMHCNVRCALRYSNMTLEILTRQSYTYFDIECFWLNCILRQSHMRNYKEGNIKVFQFFEYKCFFMKTCYHFILIDLFNDWEEYFLVVGNLLLLFTFQQIHQPTLLDGLLTCSQNIIWWTV